MRLTLRDVAHFWPVVVSAMLVPVQTDALIAFSAQWRGWLHIDLPGAIGIVSTLATAKLVWSCWFWGWLRELIADTNRFQRLGALAKQAAGLVRAEGYVDRALHELRLRHDQAHDYGRKLLTMTKWAACLFLLGAGAYPMWGVRGPLVVVVGITGFRQGMYALAIGNVVRVVYLMGGVQVLCDLLR